MAMIVSKNVNLEILQRRHPLRLPAGRQGLWQGTPQGRRPPVVWRIHKRVTPSPPALRLAGALSLSATTPWRTSILRSSSDPATAEDGRRSLSGGKYGEGIHSPSPYLREKGLGDEGGYNP